MGIAKPTMKAGVTITDLQPDSLIAELTVDEIYFGEGSYTSAEISTKFASKAAVGTELSSATYSIGEPGESPFKIDSSTNKLMSRNRQYAGKRTSSIELTLAGLSEKQKDYFESAAFSDTLMTIIALNREHSRGIILNGMYWVADWSGESDGLWTVVISSGFIGKTDKVVPLKISS